MLNKSIVVKYAAIASAVAAACSASAVWAAANVTNGTVVVTSRAFNATAASTADIEPANVQVGITNQTYVSQDVVTLLLTGAQFRTGTAAASPVDVSCNVVGTTSTLVLGFLAKANSSVTYRVLNTSTGLDKNSFSCTFLGSQLSVVRTSATTIGSSSVTIGYRANSGSETGTAFDVATPQGIIGVQEQFSAAIATADRFSGVVDVSQGRLTWTAGNARTLVISLTNNAGHTAGNLAADADTSFSLPIVGTGNGTEAAFSFLDDDGNGCTLADLTGVGGTAAVTGGSFSAISADCATLTVSGSNLVGSSGTDKGVTITLSKSSATVGAAIADGSFSVAPTFTVTRTTSSPQSVSSLNAGNFTINGTSVVIPYMPYGLTGTEEITQSISISNRSATTGNVTGTAFNQNGVSCNLGTVGVATARSVTNLTTGTAGINAKIAACYAGSATAPVSAFPTGTRVYITLISNTPVASTEVFANYRVGSSSRVNVLNDSQKVRAP